jgi:CheY-like chemotaxis protein
MNAQAQTHEAQFSPGTLRGRTGKFKRILIVDDDSDFRWILAHALQAVAETITTARNGCEAIERMKKGRYDVVIMDMHMPCKDGLATLQEIRKKDREVQIFVLTLAPTRKMIRDVYRERADGFFVKPIYPEDMDPLIERLTAKIWGLDKGLVESDYIDGLWGNLKRNHEEDAND